MASNVKVWVPWHLDLGIRPQRNVVDGKAVLSEKIDVRI
jgi:hypothetical protein